MSQVRVLLPRHNGRLANRLKLNTKAASKRLQTQKTGSRKVKDGGCIHGSSVMERMLMGFKSSPFTIFRVRTDM